MSRFVLDLPLPMLVRPVVAVAISIPPDSGCRPPMCDVVNKIPHPAP